MTRHQVKHQFAVMSRFQQTGHALNQADREKLMAAARRVPTLPAGAPALPAAGGQVARLGEKHPGGLGRPWVPAMKHRLEPGVGLAHVVQTGCQGQVFHQRNREPDTRAETARPLLHAAQVLVQGDPDRSRVGVVLAGGSRGRGHIFTHSARALQHEAVAFPRVPHSLYPAAPVFPGQGIRRVF